MRTWTEFLGGVLVGMGVASIAFFVWTWWWMHHMFILGVSTWALLILTLATPLFLIVLGFGLAVLGRRVGERL